MAAEVGHCDRQPTLLCAQANKPGAAVVAERQAEVGVVSLAPVEAAHWEQAAKCALSEPQHLLVGRCLCLVVVANEMQKQVHVSVHRRASRASATAHSNSSHPPQTAEWQGCLRRARNPCTHELAKRLPLPTERRV
jgi:hypothetical protein